MKHSGYLALFGTALLWSFTGVLVASNHLSAVLVSAGNALFAIISCVLIARPKLHFNPLIIAVGIAQFIVAITFNAGNQLSTVGNVIVLQYCSMVFVIVYQSIDTRKLPPVKQVVFVTLAILGMVLFFFDDLSPEGAFGNLCAIVSGIFFGLMFYLNSRPSSDAVISYMISCVIAMAVGAASLVTAGELPRLSFQDIASMAVNGFICQGIASVLLAHGLKSVPPFSSNLICMSEVTRLIHCFTSYVSSSFASRVVNLNHGRAGEVMPAIIPPDNVRSARVPVLSRILLWRLSPRLLSVTRKRPERGKSTSLICFQWGIQVERSDLSASQRLAHCSRTLLSISAP